MKQIKLAVLSSLAKNTGCYLRASYLRNSLNRKTKSEMIEPLPKSLPAMLDMLLSIPINFFKVFFSKADVFVAVKPFPNVTLPLLFAKIFRNKKIIVDVDDADFIYRRGIVGKISELVQKPFPRLFDLVTYHNDLLRDFIIKNFKVNENKLYKLDQGVDLRLFNPKQSRLEKNLLFYMGHLNVASDLDPILKAVALAQKKNKKIKLLVAGGGPDELAFRELAKKLRVRAEFTGHLQKEKIAKLLKRADICLVYCKEIEANKYRCPMKLRECLAAGKKIVCNNYGDLNNFKPYTYQSSSNIQEFADKIIQVLKKHDNREKRGAKYVKRKLDWAKLGERFFEKIKTLLS